MQWSSYGSAAEPSASGHVIGRLFRSYTLGVGRSKKKKRPRNSSPRLTLETLEDRTLLGGAPLTLPGAPPPTVRQVQVLQKLPISGSTADKPQSKVWQHDNTWWSALSDQGNSFLYRLDGNRWTQVLQLSTLKSRADTKEVGDVTHVLLLGKSVSQLVSLQYVPGAGIAPGTYKFWSQRPMASFVPISAATGAESATIDVDCQGRMWLVSDSFNDIQVRYSDSPYRTWSPPIVLDSNVSPDDISVVTALPDCKVGVLWSNQVTHRFGFRVHAVGADPKDWSPDEMPGSDSAQGTRKGLADDHINVAVASDGTLYAAVKTPFDRIGLPWVGLLVRRPSGQWDPLYTVDNKIGTRPIVLLNEKLGRLLVAYSVTEGGAGDILYTESATAPIAFGPAKALFKGSFNNPTSTKQNWTDSVVIVAGESTPSTPAGQPPSPKGSDLIVSALLTTNGPAKTNAAPQVNAGADQTVRLSQLVKLQGKVKDDGLPKPPGKVSTTWTQVSGPGTVTFAKAASASTTAKFSAPGIYVLRLTADDGSVQTADELTITVGQLQPRVAAVTGLRGRVPRSDAVDSVLAGRKMMDLFFNLF